MAKNVKHVFKSLRTSSLQKNNSLHFGHIQRLHVHCTLYMYTIVCLISPHIDPFALMPVSVLHDWTRTDPKSVLAIVIVVGTESDCYSSAEIHMHHLEKIFERVWYLNAYR